MTLLTTNRYICTNCFSSAVRSVRGYIQGQRSTDNVREYFYFIDQHGMLFLDDAKMKNFTSCFKERKFLQFFFKRIRINNCGRYEQQFPFISRCGPELNFISCNDLPIVFTHIIESENNKYELSYGYCDLRYPFNPEDICMLPKSGRIYHPALHSAGGVGLIRSALAIEISKYFSFENNDSVPTHFTWNNKTHKLSNKLWSLIPKISQLDNGK